MIAIVAVLVLTGFDSAIGRLGYRLWPGVPSPCGTTAGLRLPTLGDSKLITLTAVVLFVVVLAVSIARFG